MGNEGFFPVRIEKITALSPNVKQYCFKWLGDIEFSFNAGQFVMLNLPISGEYSTRSYSIASAPATDGNFELCIVRKPDGAGTQFLFENVKAGDELSCSLPQGSFVLPEVLPENLVMICTGTGVAPFRAMIHDLFSKNTASTKVHLIFGCRRREDLLYFDEWEKLNAGRSNFHFYPVLSREPSWPGHKGYVHQVYKEKFAGLDDVLFYICGWSFMVKEAKNNLKAMGYNRKQIKFELYD